MENQKSLRRPLTLLIGAVIYAALYAFCSQIDEVGFIQWRTAAVRFGLALPVALAALWLLMRHVLPKTEMKPDAEEKKPFCTWGAFLFILCCYVPMFLIEYPGSFTYDTQSEAAQIASQAYSSGYPLLHTLMIRFCVSLRGVLGSMNRCAALYSIIQMVLVAFCFAQFCASVSRSVSGRAARLSMLFFGQYPLHMAFASNCAKDVLFAAFLALYVALCFEEIACGITRGRRVLQVVSGVLACLLRNNMIYAMIAWVIVLLIVRKNFRRMALYGLLICALSLGINAGLKAATDAESGDVIELFSVPIQQLARVRLYAPQALDQAEMDVIDTVYQGWRFYQYEPTLSDEIKNNIVDQVFEENLGDFLKTWASVGAKCPAVYLDAFLNLALPSLYPYRVWHGAAEYLETGCNGDVLSGPFGAENLTQPECFAGIRRWLDEHLWETGAAETPVIRWLFNTGAVYWLMMLLFLYDIYSGRRDRIRLELLIVLLWVPYLFGPVMQARYMYPFVCVLPLFAFRRGTLEDGKAKGGMDHEA